MLRLTKSLVRRCCHQQMMLVQNLRVISSDGTLPVITVPQKMVRKLEKHQLKQSTREERRRRPTRRRDRMVIACHRSEYNHHHGDRYHEEEGGRHLASHGWKHPKSVGDYFTLVSYSKNPAVLDEENGVQFSQQNINSRLLEGLEKLGYHTMTSVQVASINKILKGEQLLIAAETGSGKTLAYLVPILERIVQQIQFYREERKPNAPRALVIVPSRELAEQIGDVVEGLAPYTDVTHHVECGGRGTKKRLVWPQWREMDILISTPGILAKQLSAGHISGRNLQHVILDEADSLLDDSFKSTLSFVIDKLQVSSGGGREVERDDTERIVVNEGVQFVLVSATLPRGLHDIVGHILPVDDVTTVTTPGLHRLMPHVPQKFLRVKMADKAEEVITILKKKRKRTMIFCNKSSTTYWLSKTLEENNIGNILLTGVLPEKERQGRYEEFEEGEKDVMVATDIASRGLDTTSVEHVINFDFPLFMSDYIHRAGRVGRVGGQTTGHVTSFVCQRWDVDLLWKIETAARKQSELHNVNANIKRKMDMVVASKYPFLQHQT